MLFSFASNGRREYQMIVSKVIKQLRKCLSAYQELSTFVQVCIWVGFSFGLDISLHLKIYQTYVSTFLLTEIEKTEVSITPLLLLVIFALFLATYNLQPNEKFKIRLRKPYYFIIEPHICNGKLAYKARRKSGKVERKTYCPKHRCPLLEKQMHEIRHGNIYFVCSKKSHTISYFYKNELDEGYEMAKSIAESKLKF